MAKAAAPRSKVRILLIHSLTANHELLADLRSGVR